MKRLFRLLGRSFLLLGTTFVTLLCASVWAGPPTETLDLSHASVKAVLALKAAVSSDLMRLPDVLGTAVGLNEAGQPALVVFVDRDGAARADVVRGLPPALGGIPLRVELSDIFRAFAGKPGGGGDGLKSPARNASPA